MVTYTQRGAHRARTCAVTHTHAHTHTRTRGHMHTCMHSHMCTHVHVTRTHMHALTHTCTRGHTRTREKPCSLAHSYTHGNTKHTLEPCTHTYPHAHDKTCTHDNTCATANIRSNTCTHTHTHSSYLPTGYVLSASRGVEGPATAAGVTPARLRARACKTGSRKRERERRTVRGGSQDARQWAVKVRKGGKVERGGDPGDGQRQPGACKHPPFLVIPAAASRARPLRLFTILSTAPWCLRNSGRTTR